MRRYKKIIIMLMVVVLVLPLLIGAFYNPIGRAQSTYTITEADREKAEVLAHETGAKKEAILRTLENTGDWNTVIQKVTRKKTAGKDLLATKNPSYEGYTDEEISEATQLVEMILYKLDEIILLGEEIDSYKELRGKMDVEETIGHVLAIENVTGSFVESLDRYLEAQQLHLSIEEFLEDQEAYERKRQQEEALYGQDNIITTADIEEKLIKVLSAKGPQSVEEEENQLGPEVPNPEDILPNVQVPTEEVQPVNPLDELKKEIDAIIPSLD